MVNWSRKDLGESSPPIWRGVVELEAGQGVFPRPQNPQPRDEATYFECRLGVQTPVWVIELTKWTGEVHTLDACSHP